MAQQHLEQVLTATGLTPEQVKAIVDLPAEQTEFKTDDYVAPIRSNVETQVKNDPKFYEGLNKENLPKEFYKSLEAEQYGRAANIVRTNVLKAVGLSEKDFADLGEEGKKLEVFTPAFAKKLSEGKVTDKELQEKLIQANTKIQELESAAPTIEEKYKTEYEQKVSAFSFAHNVISELSGIEGLKAPVKFISGGIIDTLRSKYAFEIVDNVVELRQKDKPTLKVLVDNGTKELTLSAAIKTILETEQLIDAKKTTTTKTTVTVNTGENGLKIGKAVNDKIAKRIKDEADAG